MPAGRPDKLVIGLGNPGPEYAASRHNLGFMCLNYFARLHGIRLDAKQGMARTGSGTVAGRAVMLARPQTYMNSSGKAVAWLAAKFSLSPADIIVVHDDMDLPTGRLRIRQGGSAAGHRGIASIIQELGSPDFIRLRVGISHPAQSGTCDYVLSGFTPEEKAVIDRTIPRVSDALLCLLAEGLTAAMNAFNRGAEP